MHPLPPKTPHATMQEALLFRERAASDAPTAAMMALRAPQTAAPSHDDAWTLCLAGTGAGTLGIGGAGLVGLGLAPVPWAWWEVVWVLACVGYGWGLLWWGEWLGGMVESEEA